MQRRAPRLLYLGLLMLLGFACSACSGEASSTAAQGQRPQSSSPAVSPQDKAPSIDRVNTAPPAKQTGGFDGQKAYDQVAKLVSFGPRPPDSEGIHRSQEYIRGELKKCGCAVEEHDFRAATPIGISSMKNIIAKVPGDGPGIILLLTHYDTLNLADFVGAVDGGSSTGLMLEMARNLCGHKQRLAVWMAFLDGEEAFYHWSDTDSIYGSRELAAQLANSGEIKQIKAVILADMVGPKDLKIERDSNSTPWLTDLVWKTAARLGYGAVFVSAETSIEDDHLAFTRRRVPSVDIIDLNGYIRDGYWHTTADTLDKVSPRSLAIVGHVMLETVRQLQEKT